MVVEIKREIGKIPLIRQIYYTFAPACGDTIREVVQKPIVHRYLAKNLGKTLDDGCGGGMYTQYIKKNSKWCVSLDVQLTHIKQLSKKNTKANLIQGDSKKLPFKDDYFDTVLCTEVIEHLEDDSKGLYEIARVLKKGGRLILSVPVPPAPFKGKDNSRFEHKREGYEYEEIRNLLEKHGMRIIRHEFNFLVFSRLAFKMLQLPIKMPGFVIMFISSLDYLLIGTKEKFRPYDIVIEAIQR